MKDAAAAQDPLSRKKGSIILSRATHARSPQQLKKQKSKKAKKQKSKKAKKQKSKKAKKQKRQLHTFVFKKEKIARQSFF